MMAWKPYIFIVGVWSQWDREVVVVEAETMKDERRDGSLRKVDGSPSLFPSPSSCGSETTKQTA